MKNCISFALLLSFICLLHAQTDINQQNSGNSVDFEVGDADDQEEPSEDDQLSLLRRPSYGTVGVSWRVSGQPLWFQSEEDTVIATVEGEKRPKGSCLTSCIILTVAAATCVILIHLIWEPDINISF